MSFTLGRSSSKAPDSYTGRKTGDSTAQHSTAQHSETNSHQLDGDNLQLQPPPGFLSQHLQQGTKYTSGAALPVTVLVWKTPEDRSWRCTHRAFHPESTINHQPYVPYTTRTYGAAASHIYFDVTRITPPQLTMPYLCDVSVAKGCHAVNDAGIGLCLQACGGLVLLYGGCHIHRHTSPAMDIPGLTRPLRHKA